MGKFKSKENIIYMIVLALVSFVTCISVCTATTYAYNSSNIGYDNTISQIDVNNTQDAIDELYSSATDYNTIQTKLNTLDTYASSTYVDEASNTEDNIIVSANNSVVIGTINISKSGYTPIGVNYVLENGTNRNSSTQASATYAHVMRFYLKNNSQIEYEIINRHASKQVCAKIQARVLWKKNR